MRDPKYPILIDEEGGKFQDYLKLINTSNLFKFFGKLFEKIKLMEQLIYEEYLYFLFNYLKKQELI